MALRKGYTLVVVECGCRLSGVNKRGPLTLGPDCGRKFRWDTEHQYLEVQDPDSEWRQGSYTPENLVDSWNARGQHHRWAIDL